MVDCGFIFWVTDPKTGKSHVGSLAVLADSVPQAKKLVRIALSGIDPDDFEYVGILKREQEYRD